MSYLFRQATVVARQVSRTRSFASSAVSRKDLIQEAYLREIKAYKPAPIPKDAHVGVVKQYSLPPTPKAPAPPADLASELSAYDATEPAVVVETKAAESSEGAGEGGADAYLAFLEQDLPKVEHHH